MLEGNEKVKGALEFLSCYPFPAWVHTAVSPSMHVRSGVSLEPKWFNPAFSSLFGSSQQFLDALGTGDPLMSFGLWLEAKDAAPTTHTVTLKVRWIQENSANRIEIAGDDIRTEIVIDVELELTRTPIRSENINDISNGNSTDDTSAPDLTVITSIPRSALPQGENLTSAITTPKSTPRNRRRVPLKLRDLPGFGSTPPLASSRKPSFASGSSTSEFAGVGGIGGGTGVGGGPTMAEMVENYPWEDTVLGPKKNWDVCLRQAVDLTLKSPFPVGVWWGPDLVLIYNDAYAEMSTTKHPFIFAQKGQVAWGELWDRLGPALHRCTKGHAVFEVDDMLFMERLETLEQPFEETYHSWSWTPIIDSHGQFSGVFNATHETSPKVVAERRLNTLQLLGSNTATAQNKEAFCRAALATLEENDKDIPFAALYLSDMSNTVPEPDEPNTTPQVAGAPHPDFDSIKLRLELRGTIGIPDDHDYTPSSLSIVIHPMISPPLTPSTQFRWPIQQAIRDKQAIRVAIPHHVSDGIQRRGWGDRPLHAVVIPISSEGNAKPLGVLIAGLNTRRNFDADYNKWVDVMRSSMSSLLTASIAREDEVKRAEQLAELDAAKTALFSNASHELRTPLTLIGGPISECLAETKESNIKAKLATAARNVDRLVRLVDSLMDFSRLEAGRLEGRYSPVLFGPYVAELASVFKPVIEKAHLDYTITYDANETRSLFIDQDYMEKIIFNLIGNAFKYTLSGSIAVKVVYSERDVSLIVKDTGVGIPAADLPRIWDRFHRVEATSRSHEGTGIGLSLTKQFVSLHGGTIQVTSVVPSEDSDDHGSIFTAIFPLGKDHLPASSLIQEAPSQKQRYAKGIVAEAARWRIAGDSMTPSDSDESYGSLDGQRYSDLTFRPEDLVLLVDDNQDMLEYIKEIFGRYCRVRIASNGQIALEMARKYSPQLIISDVMMPVLDGFGLVVALKEDPLLQAIPIILLSARAGDSNKAEGILCGADDYVPKPFSSRELLARASLQIQLGKSRRDMESQFQERTKEVQILTDLSPAGLFRVNNDGNMLQCNDRFREFSGLGLGQETQWLDFVHQDYQKQVTLALTDALQQQRDGSVDFVFSNGIWVKCSFRWWKHGLVGTVTDMTMTRLYEEALTSRAEDAEERRIEAEERRRSQELLMDVTSHELRQPVSAVINCASVVLGNLTRLRKALGDCEEKKQGFEVTPDLLSEIDKDLESLNAIELCGIAQGHIVNDILTLSRMQLHMLTLHESTFPLVREVRQVCSILFNEMESKGIKYGLNFGDSIQKLGIKYVSADKIRFGQVIINLLSNAIKFSQISPKKLINIDVEVSQNPPTDGTCRYPSERAISEDPIPEGERVPIHVYVSVQDSGPGLQPKDLELLFQRFQKGTNSEVVFGGSGLGLFVSRKICDLLGGKIEVWMINAEEALVQLNAFQVDACSIDGNGSIFRFYVLMHTESVPLSQTQVSQSPDETTTAPPLRVLVAEDNHTVLVRQLGSNNCIPSAAVNGAEAVDAVLQAGDKPFDCILMDCEMPVMSGLDATRELRRLEAEGLVPPQRQVHGKHSESRHIMLRRRGGGGPPTAAQRVAWKLERNLKQSIRQQEEARAAAAWRQDHVPDIDQIEVPESFLKDPVMRLWYIAHCGPDGTFLRSNGAQDYPMFASYHPPPTPPLRRRLRIARKLIPLVLPRYAAFIWRMAGWRAVVQIVADASLGFLPAWGTFAQGR
ncbi:hypothetical protein FRC17_010162, partial [Serendipita sp. 399]